MVVSLPSLFLFLFHPSHLGSDVCPFIEWVCTMCFHFDQQGYSFRLEVEMIPFLFRTSPLVRSVLFHDFFSFRGFDVCSSSLYLDFMTPTTICGVFVEGEYLVKSCLLCLLSICYPLFSIDLYPRSFIPLPHFFNSRRSPPLLTSSLVLFPQHSESRLFLF